MQAFERRLLALPAPPPAEQAVVHGPANDRRRRLLTPPAPPPAEQAVVHGPANDRRAEIVQELESRYMYTYTKSLPIPTYADI
ncbi:MAG: hypothetical protein ABW185_01425 [Sedimenticola sp.]